ncbi:hypothetical protein A9Q84_18170 [Halobacteriovorax marinus]|uniref:Thioredoxin domain-containing protein n=1 Tax=Halobacteriovorax marinus TaxID=97084 RepID=A0A1Y5F7E0_9BACT|nr:hypothetical protein A9Q84_18170 [Halobacteriovorax marinus]
MKEETNLFELWESKILSKMNLFSDFQGDYSEFHITLHNATWCPDCERESTDLLAMIKVLDKSSPKLEIIHYEDRAEYKDKKDRGQLSIHCLPTIIFHDKLQREIGRIEEQSIPSFHTVAHSLLVSS